MTALPARRGLRPSTDRKSTRLNSSHITISYAVFCLKKKKLTTIVNHTGARRPTGNSRVPTSFSPVVHSRELHCRFNLFFFNDTATTEIYTLSLHDALPI